MTSSSNNTLVIGGAGYIGSHLTAQLLATGRKVTVLGRSLVPSNALPNGVNYIAGQHQLITELLDKHEEVIHLAYATVPNTSFENPLADLLQNLPPTVQLFSEIADRGIKLVLVSSGGTVYGEAEKLPIPETHPTKPISPYGVTKLTLENYAYLYAATHGLKFICVRPANAYGAGQKPFVGQGFISTAIASVMRGQPIKIFGQTGSVRDYIYVSDLAAGIVCALESGSLSETYNIGSGVGLSNMDVINAITPLLESTNCKLSVEHYPERTFDVKSNVLDATKIQQLTGWQPKVQFKDGLLFTLDWLKKNYG
ncbi:MAG TPA: NAD-dependent epimerase/dehydratase family protein [Methylotenera sp.]|nr:NAD-dependent epimerase/dehydratase family protein [Methylotenera sp.]